MAKITPLPEQITGLRIQIQTDRQLGITAAQDYCAALLHTSRRAWQQWETGDRSMHPAFWELAQIKTVMRNEHT